MTDILNAEYDRRKNPKAGSAPRILHPVRQLDDWPSSPPSGHPVRYLIVLDTETTGLDDLQHCMIEVCAARIAIDERGHLVALERIRTGLQDPGKPLSEKIIEITGLTDADLAGQSIDSDELAAFLSSGDAVVAFNSGFDRPFVEHLLSSDCQLEWACAMRDIPWRKLGFEPGSQGYLLAQAGYFNPVAHRARDDVLSLIQLLAHEASDGETIAAKLLTAVKARHWRFEAQDAHFCDRHALKDAGYRWSGRHKLWHKHVRSNEFRREYRWYTSNIGLRPAVASLPATERYRAEYTWNPKPQKRLKLRWPGVIRFEAEKSRRRTDSG